MIADSVTAPAPPVGRWATLVDVTLRDGGYEVDFDWPLDVLTAVPAAMHSAGVEVVEVGYIGGLPHEHHRGPVGVGADIGPDHVRRAYRDGVVLAAMLHPRVVTTRLDLGPYAAAGLGMIRLIHDPGRLDGIVELAAHARAVGLTVAVNITHVSRYGHTELAAHLCAVGDEVCPDVLCLADSCGALYPGQVGELVRRVRRVVDAEIGFHGHDFLHLAYANALAAVDAGATYVDVSLMGLGRGGGNLVAEPLLLRHRSASLDLAASELLLACRHRLAAVTGRHADSLTATACAVLNLTSAEQRALRQFAAAEQIDPDRVALWLLRRVEQPAILRLPDLQALWRQWPATEHRSEDRTASARALV